MTIDAFLIRPISHHLGGMIGAARAAHSEIEFKKKTSPESIAGIKSAREAFLLSCEDIINNPAKYAKQPDYQLLQGDSEFLQQLLEKARQIDWENSQQIKDLEYFVDVHL